MKFSPKFFLLMTLFVIQLLVKAAAKDEDLKCGVCRAIIGDINISIRSVDPKKKVQVGSFRVDSNGNQNTREIPLSRSELHLGEQFEKICDKMSQWGVAINKQNGRRGVIRKYNLDGAMVSTENMKLDDKAQQRLTSLCHDFVEEHEEEAIPVFQVEGSTTDDHEKVLCIDMLGVCTEEEIKFHKEIQSQGIRDAIMGQAKSGKDTLNLSPGGGIVNDDSDEDDDDDDDFDEEDEEEDTKENIKEEL